MKPTSDLNILPNPQKLTLHGGSVPRARFRTLAVPARLPAALMKHVRLFAERHGLALSTRQAAESHTCTTVRFDPARCPERPQGSILVRLNPAASVRHPEGHVLHVGEQIVLDAAEERGLFYGLQTLQQLLDRATAIPRCTIEDWPALALRGFYFDLTRQAPTTDFLKRIVDRLAAVKINLLMIQYREFFPYEGFPLVVSEAAYTRREFADFVQYAAERHVQVAPLLQSLSFQEHILRGQAYAHLRERPGDATAICPTHPESFRLYTSLAEQLIAAHPGARYFHLAGDEANTVGQCPRCKAALSKGSKASLVSGFTNQIIRVLRESGLTPMMWADMLFGHLEDSTSMSQYGRAMFAELSRDVVAADWDYWSTGPETPPAERNPYRVPGLSHVQRLLDAGFRVVGAPSCSSCCNAERNAIDHALPFENITAFSAELRRRSCLGMLNTFWPTDASAEVRWCRRQPQHETVDVCYRQVRPGLEAHWYSIWRGAECAWSAEPRAKEDYERIFCRLFLGANDTSYTDALNLASFPRGGAGDKAKTRQALVRMRQAQRSVGCVERTIPVPVPRKRDGCVSHTLRYSDLFLRLQHHALLWDEFQSKLPAFNAPKLSDGQLRAWA